MTLIKSISGIRGTIGGHVSDGLNPISTAQFTAAYASFIRQQTKKARPLIIVGRDARISGHLWVNRIARGHSSEWDVMSSTSGSPHAYDRDGSHREAS